jgi:PhnB protein
MENIDTQFAPHLAIKVLQPALNFYERAFGVQILKTLNNPDGSVHVAEITLSGRLFHLHEETARHAQLSPETVSATTVVIGVFTPNPDALFNSAVAAGATVISPMQDYDYGYRQGTLADPFGHQWLIQKKF